MYRRKRRARATWFPNLGITVADGTLESAYNLSFNRTSIAPNLSAAVPPWELPNTVGFQPFDIFALIPDQTKLISVHDAEPTLRDYVDGQEWFLDAIVGSIHVSCNRSANQGEGDPSLFQVWSQVIVTVGICVADAQDGDSTKPEIELRQLDPADVDNIRSPWVFRRSWVLGNPGAGLDNDEQAGGAANTNQFITGMQGPQVRTKTKRRIRRNQRLWFVASVVGFDFRNITMTGTQEQQPVVNILADLRICGKMRKARNVSAF